MNHALRTLCLTESSLDNDLALALKYQDFADLYELRADCLPPSQWKSLSSFPQKLPHPTILTCRRRRDGGLFDGKDTDRSPIFQHLNAFAFVDLETDNQCTSAEELLSKSPSTRLIRSIHLFSPTPLSFISKLFSSPCPQPPHSLPPIPKIAFTPTSLKEVADLFSLLKTLPPQERIICAMGPLGIPSRILASLLPSFLTYSSLPSLNTPTSQLGHIHPKRLSQIFHSHTISPSTAFTAVTGWPLSVTSSPEIHRSFYDEQNLDATLIPLPTPSIEEAIYFAKTLHFRGLAVTVPHKQSVIPFLSKIDPVAQSIGAVNTVVIQNNECIGYNTDALGFCIALTNFLSLPISPNSLANQRVAIIGSGGAAAAIAYALHSLGATQTTIYARNLAAAKKLASKYNFSASPLSSLSPSSPPHLIVQCTSVGNGTPNDDPIPFYQFTGTEALYDLVYQPSATALMTRAAKVGVRTENGLSMLKAQARLQHNLFFP